MFILPPGSQPNRTEYFAATNPLTDGYVHVEVRSNGQVRTPDPHPSMLSLDGITFRCGPSGENDCP